MRDLKWLATPAAVVLSTAVLATILLTRPAPVAELVEDPAQAEAMADLTKAVEGMATDVAKVHEETARNRCELHRLNAQIGDMSGRAYLGTNGC
ncbi:hypothetical protein [Brevundimonas sp.]|uniref:hypothetical protein n=1 Tax=Brevundimonas sp. TaxID=1871086 RepID=UPI00261BD86B|nr:hypothetical protein [Brevundimonas sp.]